MATFRTVLADWLTLTGDASAGQTIRYELDRSSFTAEAIVDHGHVDDVIGIDGTTSTDLWANLEGLVPSRYTVTFPKGDQYGFHLPAGDTAISLTELLVEQSIPWQPPMLSDFIDAAIDGVYDAFANTTDVELGDGLVGYRAAGTGAIARTVHARFADEPVNVCDYGARPDERTVMDGGMLLGSTTVVSATAAFTPDDVGKSIVIRGAGPPGNTLLITTITAYISPTEVTAATPAGTMVGPGTLTIGAGERTVTDVITTAGESEVRSASAAFTGADVGKAFTLTAFDGTVTTGTLDALVNSSRMTTSVVLPLSIRGRMVMIGTDLAPAWALASVAAGPDGTLFLPPGRYAILSTMDVLPVRAVMGYGARLRIRPGRLVRVRGSGIAWQGVTFYYEGAGVLFTLKGTDDDGSTKGDFGGWSFTDCVFDGVSPRFSRMDRLSVPINIARTTTVGVTAAGALTLTVASAAPLTGRDYVRLGPIGDPTSGPDYGSYTYHHVESLIGTTLNFTPAITGELTAGRRVDGVTRAVGAHAAGATTLALEDVTGATVGTFFQAYVSRTVIVQGMIAAVDTGANTLTVADWVDQDGVMQSGLSGAIPAGTYVGIMNEGTNPTGTDLWHDITLQNCEVKNIQVNFAVEIAGAENVRLSGCKVHDCQGFVNENEPDSGVNPNVGEAIKISAGSDRVTVEGCHIWNFQRDGIDAFDAGEVTILGNYIWNSYAGKALEMKWNTTDLTPAQPVRIIGNYIRNMFQTGLLIGGNNVICSGNYLDDVGTQGIYINGGRPDDADEHASTNVIVANNIVRRATLGGIWVSEGVGVVIIGNRCYENPNGVYIGPFAATCVITANDLRGNTSRALQIDGDATIVSGHIISGNMGTEGTGLLLGAGLSDVLINGYGSQSLGSAGAPSTARWPIGALLSNSFDLSLWLREPAGMTRLAKYGDLPTGATYKTWETVNAAWTTPGAAWNGSETKTLTGGDSGTATYTLDLVALFGIPATAVAVDITWKGRWTAATASNAVQIGPTSGANRVTRHAAAANNMEYAEATIRCIAGKIKLTVLGATMNDAYIRVYGYYV